MLCSSNVMMLCTDKLLMKLKLEHEFKVGQGNISGSLLMHVTDMIVVDTLTSQQLRIVKYSVTKLLIGVLADQSLITRVLYNSLCGNQSFVSCLLSCILVS